MVYAPGLSGDFKCDETAPITQSSSITMATTIKAVSAPFIWSVVRCTPNSTQ
jgi:hypothetical protein